jgi:hypothetical protein
MKRFAAHSIFLPPDRFYQLHYVELDDSNHIQKIAPLELEIAQTSFYNGVIVVLNDEIPPNIKDLEVAFLNPDEPVKLYHLSGINLLPSELSAGNSGGDCHIQRLC